MTLSAPVDLGDGSPPGAMAKPALVLATYARADLDADARTALAAHHAALWQALGLADEIPALRVGHEWDWPAAARSSPRLEVLAARRRVATGAGGAIAEFDEALVLVAHDLVVFATLLGSNLAIGWDALEQRWVAAGGDRSPGPVLGTARIHSALVEADGASALPSPWTEPASVTLARAVQTATGLAVWERHAAADQVQLLVLAAQAAEDARDDWIWRNPGLGGRDLGSGLLHLTAQVLKIRDQQSVYQQRSAALRHQMVATEAALDAFMDHLDTTGQTSSGPRWRSLHDELTAQEGRSGGLLSRMSELRDLAATLTIAAGNVQLLTPRPGPGQTAALFAVDRLTATELPQQIEIDLGYAQSVVDRAEQAHRRADGRIQSVMAAQGRTQARLSLFQTTLIGGLLAALGAITTFNATITLAERLRAPAVLLIGALVFAVPQLIVDWADEYTVTDDLSGALLGGSLLLFVDRWARLGWGLGAVLIAAAAVALPVTVRALHIAVTARR